MLYIFEFPIPIYEFSGTHCCIRILNHCKQESRVKRAHRYTFWHKLLFLSSTVLGIYLELYSNANPCLTFNSCDPKVSLAVKMWGKCYHL
jgi:hypothetical protein